MPEVSEDNTVRLNVGEYMTAERISDCYHDIFVKVENVDPLQAWMKLPLVYSIMRVSEDKYVVMTADLEATRNMGSSEIFYKKDEYAFDKVMIKKQNPPVKSSFISDSEKTQQWLERWARR